MNHSANTSSKDLTLSKQQENTDEVDVLLQELDEITDRKNKADNMSSKLKDMLQKEKEAVRSFNYMRMQEKEQKEELTDEEDLTDEEELKDDAASNEEALTKHDSSTEESIEEKAEALPVPVLDESDDLDYLDDEKEEISKEDEILKEEPEDEREDFLASLDKRTEKIVHERLRKAEPKRLTNKRNANLDEKIFVNSIREVASAKIQNMVVMISYLALIIILFATLIVDRKNMPQEESCFLQMENAAFEELVSDYYRALETEDLDTVKRLLEDSSSVEEEHLLNRMEEVKMYKDNIFDSFEVTDCIIQAGLKKNEYIVYCQYEIKIKEVETPAPGLLTLYVVNVAEEDAEAQYRLTINKKDSKRHSYMLKMGEQEEVKALLKKTNAELKEACKKDENLKKVVDALQTFD